MPKCIPRFLWDRTFHVRIGQSLELETRVPQESASIGIFEGTETLVGKCLYVNDLALSYSAKATTTIMQGAVDTLVENVARCIHH